MSRFINLSNARSDEQEKVMMEIKAQGHCPFCSENIPKYHKKPILHTGKYWLITENQWPYDLVKHQLLAIYKDHIEHVNDLPDEAGAELIRLFKDESKKRGIIGGGIAIRFGTNPDKGNYGSTVAHLHAHLIEPDLDALGETDSFKFSFGKPKNYKKESK